MCISIIFLVLKEVARHLNGPYQEQHQLENFGLGGAEDLMFDIDELLNLEYNVTQLQGFND